MTAGKVSLFVLAVGTAIGLAATLVGQEPRPERYQANKPVINEPWQSGNVDGRLAQCILGDNQGEITLGKLAEERAKDKDVKQFAEKMVRDHEQFGQQLDKFAREGDRPIARTDIRNPVGGPAATTTSPPPASQWKGAESICLPFMNKLAKNAWKCSKPI